MEISKFTTKKYMILSTVFSALFIITMSWLLSRYIPIKSVGKIGILVIVILENGLLGFSCFFIASNLTWSVIKRNSIHHFINLPSLAFAAAFFYGGITMIMELVTIKYKFWWAAILIRLFAVIASVILAIGTFKKSKYLVELPDVNQLLTTIEKLEKRVDILKSTNPYLSEEGFDTSEKLDLEVLVTLKRVTAFLQTLETSTAKKWEKV